MTTIPGTLVLEQLFARDRMNASPEARSPLSPVTPQRKRSLVHLRKLMYAINDVETSPDASPVHLARELWMELQQDIASDDDYQWLLDQVAEGYQESLEEAKFDSGIVQNLFAMPDIDTPLSGKQPPCTNNDPEGQDPEMGYADESVLVSPLSLNRFAKVHDLQASQQEQLLLAIARMAGRLEENKLLAPALPTRRSSLDLIDVDLTDDLTIGKHGQVTRLSRAKTSWCYAFTVCSLLLLAGAVVCGLTSTQFSSIRFSSTRFSSTRLSSIQFSLKPHFANITASWKRLQKQMTPVSNVDNIIHSPEQPELHSESPELDEPRQARDLPVSGVGSKNADDGESLLQGSNESAVETNVSASLADVVNRSVLVASPAHGTNSYNNDCTYQNIHKFAHWGDLDQLQWCLSLHPEWVNHSDENSWTALHEASAAGSLDVVEFLVHAGASVRAVNSAGQTSYELALHEVGANHEVTKFLQHYQPHLHAGTDGKSAETKQGDAPTHPDEVAASRVLDPTPSREGPLSAAHTVYESATNRSDVGSQATVTVLVHETGVGYSQFGDHSSQGGMCTPDHINWLIYFGHVGELQHCFTLHPEYIHRVDDLGWSPLHEASRASHVHVVTYLLRAGANAGAHTNAGQTAWEIARGRHGKDHAVTKALQEHSENASQNDNVPNSLAETVLLNAPERDQHHSPSESINTPESFVETMGVNEAPEITNDIAKTEATATKEDDGCLHLDFLWSASTGELDKIKQCVSVHPALLDQADENGWTALHEASRSGHLETVEYLLQAGANVHVLTTNGKQTALDLARQALGDEHAVTMLLQSAVSKSQA